MYHTFEELIRAGVYKAEDVDDDGNILYSCDLEIAKKVAPDVYIAETNEIIGAVLEAISLGYIELDVFFDENDELSFGYNVTEKGMKID